MSMLEDWLNMFGGNDSLKPNTHKSTAAEAWRSNARSVPNTTPVVPKGNIPIQYPNVGSGPKLSSYKPNWVEGQVPNNRSLVPVEVPTRASARGTPTRNVGSGPNYNTTPSNVGSGARVNTAGVPETTGKGVTVPKGPNSLTPEFQAPTKLKYGSLLGAPAAGAEALLYSESLNVDEFGGEDGQKWLTENRPEGWTPSTMAVEETVGSAEAISSKGKREAISLAEAKLKLMIDSGASQTLIDGAAAELDAVKSAQTPDHLSEFEVSTTEELSAVQARIDNILQETGSNPELANLRIANEGLFEKRDALNAKLGDVGKIREQRVAAEVLSNLPVEDANAAEKIIKLSSGMTPDEFRALKSSDKEEVKTVVKGFFAGLFDGIPFKEMMEGAVNALGELWGDKAIQNALVYYMGARLMGYSSSGSGMAAGQVLLQGWDNQAKSDLALGVSDAKADAALLKASTLDMSKTVAKFNPRTNEVIEGYEAPNGNFQEMGSDKTYKATDLDYLTYDSSRHKTKDEMGQELMDSITSMTSSTLSSIKSNSGSDSGNKYTNEAYAQVDELFGDGNAARDVVLQVTRAMNDAGVKTNTLAFRSALEGTIQQQIRDVAAGRYEGTNMVADLTGKVNSNMLKADLKGGGIPAFVFGKGTKWSKKGVTKMDDDFQLPPVDALRLHTISSSMTNQIIDHMVRNDLASPAKARHLITKKKTIQELANVFQKVVMQDSDSIRYWTEQADGNGLKTNAFSVWLNSTGGSHEQKYMGLNNPEAMAALNSHYMSLIKKDK